MGVLSIINNKGGVGKTTSTLIISELLAYLGLKVLVIDLDGQSNASLSLHAYEQEAETNIFSLFVKRLKSKEEVRKLIQSTNIDGVDIIASSNKFKEIEKNLEECYRSPFILRKALNTIRDDYDFIVIDNSPAMNFYTLNSIVASDYIITPVRVEEYSKKGVREILYTINEIREEYDLDYVKFLGVFITQANIRTLIFKERFRDYQSDIGEKLFKTSIRNDTKIEQMESKHVPMLELDFTSNALADYCFLLLEMDILPEKIAQKLRNSIELV